MIPPDAYCREIEAYLCRKNDGHLIRIAGPAFGQVCEWARQGVPLTVAFTGIDRYFERYYRKGPRRRPVRIEFCETDVLDAFDHWRRATGVPSMAAGAGEADASPEETAHRRRGATLAAHVARVLARLTTGRGSQADARIEEALADASRVLDAVQAEAPGARGERREALLARLREVDARLLTAVREGLDGPTLASIAREADDELEPFRQRMTAAALATARQAAIDRLIRRRTNLPVIAFE